MEESGQWRVSVVWHQPIGLLWVVVLHFAIYYYLLYWVLLICSSLLSTSSCICPCPLLHYWMWCILALHMVFLPCNSAGLWLPPSYCFVLDYSFINQNCLYFHFAYVSVLLCLTLTPVRIHSIMEHLSLTTLTTMLHSIQPLATTLLADTILLKLFTALKFFPR